MASQSRQPADLGRYAGSAMLTEAEARAIALNHVQANRRRPCSISQSFFRPAKLFDDGRRLPACWSVHVSTPAGVFHEHGHEPVHTPPGIVFVAVDSETGTPRIIPQM